MTRYRAATHLPGTPSGVYPALDLVMAEVEVQPAPSDHWFWLGDFNEFREPFFRWKDGKKVIGRYSVVRLLHKLKKGLPPKSGLINICALKTCVNPDHWVVETPRHRSGKRVERVLTGFHGEDIQDRVPEPVCKVCNANLSQQCSLVKHAEAELRSRT